MSEVEAQELVLGFSLQSCQTLSALEPSKAERLRDGGFYLGLFCNS